MTEVDAAAGRTRRHRQRRVISVEKSDISDTAEEAAYRAQLAAYFDAIIQHGEAGDILRNLERAVERLAFVRACIIPFTLDEDGGLHDDPYHAIEVIGNELNYIGFAPVTEDERPHSRAV
jgi:hypothetical protein